MAYSFGAVNRHRIEAPSDGVTKAGTAFSVAFRFRINAASAVRRDLLMYDDTTGLYFNVYLGFADSGTNQVFFGFSANNGARFPWLLWTSGFAAGSLHTIVGTYDGANLKLYADTDSTAKATLAETGTPDTNAGQSFTLGNDFYAFNHSLDGILYEVAWWPTTTLTGAQAAVVGADYDARVLTPLPSNHWRLIGNASDHIGAQHGTVTGATLVAHDAPIIYPAPRTTRKFYTSAAGGAVTYPQLERGVRGLDRGLVSNMRNP